MKGPVSGDVGPASSASRVTVGRHWPAAIVLTAAVVLTGCTDDAPETEPTDGSQETPAVDSPTESAPPPTDSTSEPSPSGSSTALAQWGSYGNRSDACTAVAGNVVAVSVLPMSLNLSGDDREIDNTEDEIESMRRSAPENLKADFARVQLLVDSFGERVAAGKRAGGEESEVQNTPEGGGDGAGQSNEDEDDDGGPVAQNAGGNTGTGNGNDGGDSGDTVQSPPTESPGASDKPEFNGEALQNALDPIKRWLTKHCENRSGEG